MIVWVLGLGACGGAEQSNPAQPADLVGPLRNGDFERGWEGWARFEPTTLEDTASPSGRSVLLTGGAGRVEQTISVRTSTTYRMTASVRGRGRFGVVAGAAFVSTNFDHVEWTQVELQFDTEGSVVTVFVADEGGETRVDNIALAIAAPPAAPPADPADPPPPVEPPPDDPPPEEPSLDPSAPPGSNFELIDWYLNTPADADGDERSDRISERDLEDGFDDPRYFFTGEDGAMIFRSTVGGARTSQNTSYVRTELREMLRRGNESIGTRTRGGQTTANNWVFSTAPESARMAAGGIDGVLRATVAVRQVTTTGADNQVGRVIIGQIHAEDDEPCRLYYRLLPGHRRGSIYYAHELRGGEDQYRELIGSRSSNASEPADGIPLGEQFSYEIRVDGHQLTVRIVRSGRAEIVDTYDMSDSGYDVADEFMYFKAGAYVQDNTGRPDDYAEVAFYALENTHDGYPF